MSVLIRRFRSFGKKQENKELLTHSLWALIIRMIGAGASFLMTVVVSRSIGAKEAGYFFLAVAITTLGASIGRIGADQTVLRFVGVNSENQNWANVNAVMKKMMSWTYIPIILLALVGCIFAKPISIYLFHKEELQWPLFWASLSMPFFAGYNVHGMGLQGRRKVILSVTLLKIITPAFLIFFSFIFSPKNASTVSICYAAACVINLLLGYYWWNKNVPKVAVKVNFDSSVLWKSCWPLWISAIMQQITIWGGQLIGGAYIKPDELAQLAVARNTAVLVGFILMAVNNVSSPRFAGMYSAGKMKELKNYARNTSRLMTLIALPPTLFICFFPTFIMSIFGKDFTGGIWLLRILAIGQFINVSTGSVGTLLIMSGHEKDLKNIRIINGVVAIVLAFALTPPFGAVGSAISSAIAMASFNLMAVGMVKRRLGFNTMAILGFR